ncbi:bifunctional riboflavin kinase/FAD synthetase [Halobacillus sp. Marseille-Q1614]|uniref:bifunctional riboflavin kinase/FAD synthetase n=1 Tax=Halobacillus sp. Marseille-Q1614 TaxID=2709134 RepID=UPI001570B126|nr:bifunctional riboflavin kinase/FAD synthetase [Halobacillus sp. Marseille-Q1614]
MKTIEVTDLPPVNDQSTLLVVGKFDGLHLGHQQLLNAARSARQEGEEISVLGFSDHPLWVLKGDSDYEKALSSFQDRRQLLEQAGVDRYYHVHFTKEYAQLTPEQFVHEHLGQLQISRIIVGEGFKFGRGRNADTDGLSKLCERNGIEVTVIPHVTFNGEKVSSTKIRSLVTNGNMEAAQGLLGRPFEMTGIVEKGEQLGRELGFPTLNLGDIEEYVQPFPGVYLGVVEVHHDSANAHYYSLISAGYRPTVNGKTYKVEAYLLDFSGDLYGKTVTVKYLRFLRGEENFNGLDELVDHMKQDEKNARRILGLANTR